MPEPQRTLVPSFMLFAMLGWSSPLFAQTATPDGDYLKIQFDEIEGTPLDDFISLCARETGLQLNFNSADTKDVKLKFLGEKRLKRTEFWSYFQSVLKGYEFVVVPFGNISAPGRDRSGPDTGYFAIRKSQGGVAGTKPGYIKTGAPVVSASQLEQFKYDPGIVLTTSFTLKYVNATEAVNMLQSYFTDPMIEGVRAVSNSNALVATGFAQTLYGIQQLLQLIDVQPAEYKAQFGKFEMKHAVAAEIKPILDQLIAAERGEATGTRGAVQAASQTLPAGLQEPAPHVEADDRTNALYVVAAASSLEKIERWVRMLDVEVDPRGDTHVYRLQNSAAKDLAEILNDWSSNSSSGGGSRSSGGATPGGAAASGSGGGSSLEQPVSVVADEASNSLVITASKSRYAQVLEVIKRLDVRRRQVLIESALVEISGSLNHALGVELGYVSLDDSGNPDLSTGGFGLSNFGLSTLEDLNDDGIADRRIPIGLGDGFSDISGITAGIFGGKDFQVPIILNALQNTTDANVLSMPSVLVNDNEKANIKTKDERPSFTVSQGINSDQTSFNEYIEAGIQLEISPSISAGNYLRLTMKLEVSAFLPGSTDPPPRTTRELETAVTLPDGHTMVIGGIVKDDQRSNSDRLPWLGEFPIIGWLFRNDSDTDDRTNLYVFITPHIVSDDFATLDDLSYKKKKEMEALNGKIYLVDEDWDRDNADTRILDAAVAGVFDMPSYASPQSGEQPKEEPKPKANPDVQTYGEIEKVPDIAPNTQDSKPQSKP